MLLVEPTDRLLWLVSIGWSARHGTDGGIPETALPMLAVLAGAAQAAAAADRLTSAGLWDLWVEQDEQGDLPMGWRVHDFLDHQSSAEQVNRKATLNRKRQERHRQQAEGDAAAKAQDDERLRTEAQAEDQAERHALRDALVTPPRPRPRPRRRQEKTPNQYATSSAEADATVSPAAPDDKGGGQDHFAEMAQGFEQLWDASPKRNGKRIGKDKAHQQWRRMSTKARRDALVAIVHYAAARGDGHELGAADLHRWLRDRTYLDWLEPEQPATPIRRARPTRTETFDRLIAEAEAREAAS